MTRLVLCLALAACGGGAPASTLPPSNLVAPDPVPAPVNPARKWGYPSDADCSAAMDHLLSIAKQNPEAAQKMKEYGSTAQIKDEGFQECRRKWLLAQVDCVHSATAFEDLDACMNQNYDVPDGVDVSTAPGRATAEQCQAALDHLVAIAPRQYPDDSNKAALTDQCKRYWRPFQHACVMAAPTNDAADDCTR